MISTAALFRLELRGPRLYFLKDAVLPCLLRSGNYSHDRLCVVSQPHTPRIWSHSARGVLGMLALDTIKLPYQQVSPRFRIICYLGYIWSVGDSSFFYLRGTQPNNDKH